MYQTMDEIEKQYDGKFVCVINCKRGQYHGIIGGEVVAASENKQEVMNIWAKNPRSLFRYMGEFPKAAGGFLL